MKSYLFFTLNQVTPTGAKCPLAITLELPRFYSYCMREVIYIENYRKNYETSMILLYVYTHA